MVNSIHEPYPKHWWSEISKEGSPWWEILPHEINNPGEVILSKRHELGVLSNFAATSILFRGETFASIEGLWCMMLYPENESDQRATLSNVQWPHTRKQVAQMVGIEAKFAGEFAEKVMAEHGINWVSFQGEKFLYRSIAPDRHYELIWEAMNEKYKQHKIVQDTLAQTKGLILRPDHQAELNAPPEWNYFELWMKIRDEVYGPLSRKSLIE